MSLGIGCDLAEFDMPEGKVYACDWAKYFSFFWLKIKRIVYSDWA